VSSHAPVPLPTPTNAPQDAGSLGARSGSPDRGALRLSTKTTDRGIVLLASRMLNTDPTSFGFVLLTADTDEEASRIVDEDPAVQAGIFQATLFPYRIALVSEKLLG